MINKLFMSSSMRLVGAGSPPPTSRRVCSVISIVVAAVLVGGSMAGCQQELPPAAQRTPSAMGVAETPQSQGDPNDPYGRMFEDEIAAAQTEYVKKILQDHVITEEEYRESRNKYLKCLKEQNIHFTDPSTDGRGSVFAPEKDKEAAMKCEFDWFAAVDSMYEALKVNPNNVDWVDAMAACFVRKGIVPEGFTGNDLRPLIDSVSTKYSVGSDGGEPTAISEPESGINPALPGGALLSGDHTKDCWQKPFQAVGGIYEDED